MKSRTSRKLSRRTSRKLSRRTSRKLSRRTSRKLSRRMSRRTQRGEILPKKNTNEPTYKGKKWVLLKTYKDIKDIKNIKDIKWETDYKYNIIDNGLHLKKINPLFKDKFIRTKKLIKTFEGFIDDFINNKDFKWTERQLRYLEDFRKDIRELRKDDLLYIYAVYYNDYNKSNIDFIATNEDGSICYIRSTDLDGYNKVIINGMQLNLLSWFTMTKKDKLKLF